MAKEPKKPKATKKRVPPWSVPADAELRDLMEAAELATGKERAELIRECVRTSLPNVVKKLAEERRRGEEAFSKHLGGQGNPSGTK